jgi:hypothetical protein
MAIILTIAIGTTSNAQLTISKVSGAFSTHSLRIACNFVLILSRLTGFGKLVPAGRLDEGCVSQTTIVGLPPLYRKPTVSEKRAIEVLDGDQVRTPTSGGRELACKGDLV